MMKTQNNLQDNLEQLGLQGDPEPILERINSVTAAEVETELNRPAGRFSFKRLMTLISPAAGEYLEQMARQASNLTQQRFGKVKQLYVPLYVSNYCINGCLYCGFNCTSLFDRTRLTVDQACADAEVIAADGFRHILLLSGEDKRIDADYFCELAAKIRDKFSAIDIEIYPMDAAGYEKLCGAGIDGITLYQETYNRKLYDSVHVSGPKSDYDFRLETPQRAARAGFRRIGIGSLLGLGNWRQEVLALAVHGDYLIRNFWKSQVSFSFPRIRPANDVDLSDPQYRNIVSDAEMVQMMLALRLCFSDAGIAISTRESSNFRENVLGLCVTKISAGSKTNPGGYSSTTDAVEQFEIDDDSSPQQVAEMIRLHGFEPVWKDWDAGFYK
jgi:2-iminoacetate synthase